MSNCPKCGSTVNQGEAFCRVCGTKMPLPQNNIQNNAQTPLQQGNMQNNTQMQNNNQMQSPQSQQPSVNNNGYHSQQQVVNQSTQNYQQQGVNPALQGFQQPQNNGIMNNGVQTDSEDLIYSYIGKNADKLKNGGFSVNTLFFGAIYVLYRKMWLLGFLWLGINMIVNMFLSSVAFYITITANIIISTQFKKWYMKNVEEQIEKIKNNNPGKSKEQLMMLCSQKGGTTIIPVIIASVIYVVAFILVFIAVTSILNDANNASKHSTSSGVIGELNVTIPSMLEGNKNSGDHYKHYSSSYDNDGYCGLTLTTMKVNSSYNNDDVKKYLEEGIYYSAGDTYSGVSEKTLNNNPWYYATVTSDSRQEYYYATIYNDALYSVEFSILSDDNKTCSNAYNTIINSLRFD